MSRQPGVRRGLAASSRAVSVPADKRFRRSEARPARRRRWGRLAARLALTGVAFAAVIAGMIWSVQLVLHAEVLKVISYEAKKRREAAEAFAQGGRTESAEREKAEGEVLTAYLPQPLTDDELQAIVVQAIEEAKAAGAEGPRAMGAVMKIVSPKVAGRAEGGQVAAVVKKLLAG